MKVYKQMKMYNDPALNPVLYAKDNEWHVSSLSVSLRLAM